jgi:hypothetical protein
VARDALKIVARGAAGRQGCRMKYVAPRPFADPAVTARKLLEIATTEAVRMPHPHRADQQAVA